VIALKEVVMSERVDQFCDKLRERLNAIEGRIQSVKTDVQALPAKAEKALQQKLDEARTKVEAQKQRVEKARADLKAWADQKVAETKEAIDEWKAKREARKLIARADRAEAYAEAAMVIALASIDEAEEAVLDAVAARRDADAAK
jgi:chromosome segregation ATPase